MPPAGRGAQPGQARVSGASQKSTDGHDEDVAVGADPADFNPFVERVELEGVDVVELAATRHALGQPDNASFEVEGGHQVVDGTLFVRFEVRASALREAGPDAGP